MTAKARSSVRMGPITLLVLVVVLCLAVLTVLSLVTARSQQAVTQQQATTVEAGYRNEVAAQGFLAQVDGILAQGRAGELARSEVMAAVSQLCEGVGESTVADDPFSLGGARASTAAGVASESATFDAAREVLSATFMQDGGRKLAIEIAIEDDLTYAVLAWRATTEWVEPGMGNMLWEG